MVTTAAHRTFIENISELVPGEVRLRGWVYRLRILGKTAFVILRDCSGEAQCVIASEALRDHKLKVEDVVEILGCIRADPRARSGYEVDISEIRVLNRAGHSLPFQSAAPVDSVALETLIQYRPLSLRTEAVGDILRMQAAILASFRDALNRRRFTEIVTSKMSIGTVSDANLLGVVVSDITNPLLPQLTRGAECSAETEIRWSQTIPMTNLLSHLDWVGVRPAARGLEFNTVHLCRSPVWWRTLKRRSSVRHDLSEQHWN